MDDQRKQYLTREKHEELVKELDFLKTVRRREIAKNLEYAKSLGDLSENAEYQEARDEQAKLEDRISHLEAILQVAEIVKPRQSETIDVGSTVVVRKAGGAESSYHLVGSEEADLASGKISDQAPLGAALIGKKKGDQVSIKTPGGMVVYEIVEVK
jgi:transcription elongation factor GreA